MKQFHALIVRGLLRAYPRAWRDRYGEEFTALLAELPPSTGQTFDLALGAIDAHGQKWKERTMGRFDTRPLDGDERRFWLHWVLQLLVVGALIGTIYSLVPVILATFGASPFGAGPFTMAFKAQVIGGPILMATALGLGLAQWRALRPLLPTLSRWWIALTLLGPLVALTIMTTDRSYSRFTDLLSMAQYFYSNLLGQTIDNPPPRPIGFYSNSLFYILPVTTFAGIATTLQAFALKGNVNGSGWWIAVAMVAAIAGLGAARLFAPLRIEGYRIAPLGVKPDLLLLDTGALILQLGAACAAYGIVSGLGLLALRRLRRAQALTPLTA